ncbi:MAG: hypothetical protein PT977_07530 [Acidobacteriota bacterium]|nr:hypothetical protein [Acidobacteriota bacterium]
MRWNRCLPALALLVFLPARAEEGAAKAPPPADAKPADGKKMSCCAGEDADKALCPKTKEQPATAPKKHAVKKSSAGAANMVVTRDPETGELRNATAAERAKLFAGRAPQAAPATPRVVTLPDGTQMIELGEDTMNYAIATKNPDGSIRQGCVHGSDAAAQARTAPKPAPAPRAEER